MSVSTRWTASRPSPQPSSASKVVLPAPSELPQLQGERLRAQAKMFAAVSSHGTIVGTAREIALIEFLRSLIPKRYEVLTGAVAKYAGGRIEKATNQLDVLVVDTLDYPTFLRTGDLAIALGPSVRSVVEAKSDLGRGPSFREAIKQIAQAKMIAGGETLTSLFCFRYPAKSKTLRTWLSELVEHRTSALARARAAAKRDDKQRHIDEASYLSAANLPDVVLSDKGAIAIRHDQSDGKTLYFFYSTVDGVPSIVALASTVLGHIARPSVASGPDVGETFQILIEHFNAGLEASVEAPLDVTDEQPDGQG